MGRVGRSSGPQAPGGACEREERQGALREHGAGHGCFRDHVELNDSESSERTEEAAYALSRYCSGGEAEACCQLGKAHEVGKKVSKDLEKSDRLRRKACDLGLVSCCP